MTPPEIDEDLLREVSDERTTIGMAIVGSDGRWLKVNPPLCHFLGYDEDELIEMTFQQITHPEDLEAEQPYLQRLTVGNIDHYQFKKRYLHKSGHTVWGQLDRSAVRDSSGKPSFFVSRIRDITAEKAQERKETPFWKIWGAAISARLSRKKKAGA